MSAKHEFIRRFDDARVAALKGSDFFKQCLKKDCQNGQVFPAIRNNQISFYYYGRRLFFFDKKGFLTNPKYEPVQPAPVNKYTTQGEAKQLYYASNYGSIKNQCRKIAIKRYKEGAGLSPLYLHGNLFERNRRFGLLDIEISFAKDSDEPHPEELPARASTDRIDALFLCDGVLRFVEAKRFTSPELGGDPPQVLGQIKGYRGQIKRRKGEILTAYKGYTELLNRVFDMNIPTPRDVHEEVGLMVFGYDSKQRKSALSLRDSVRNQEVCCHAIGSVLQMRSEGQIEKLLKQTGGK